MIMIKICLTDSLHVSHDSITDVDVDVDIDEEQHGYIYTFRKLECW
jgi:hypothetical protein